jgi:lysine 2,3-aminomutase
MAGHVDGRFPVKLSSYLDLKRRELLAEPELAPAALRAIERQYLFDPREDERRKGEVRRHYEAEIQPIFEGRPLQGIERLYRRSLIVEPTMLCAAHCRWCIRGQYEPFHLPDSELERIARWVGTAAENRDIREVLITGGDPLTSVKRLRLLVEALFRHAPQVTLVRVGTRVPLQAPRLVDERLSQLLRDFSERMEIGLHVNHPAELFSEVVEACARIRATGVRVYNQSVLLRGLNDDIETLSELGEALRRLHIEMHYLFHAVPLRGMRHHRTSIARGLDLVRELTSCGSVSGRAKPTFTLLTDVGKVTPYEGTILERRGQNVLLQRATTA